VKHYLRSIQASVLYQFSSSSLFYMAGLGLLFFAGLSGNTTIASAQAGGVTNIQIGTTVKTPNAKRLGMNLSGQSFYDSGQMLRNVIFRNPGFEGEIWRSVLKCKTVVGNGCYADDPWSSWPKNFLQGATVQFISGPSKGLTGTITGLDIANANSNISTLLHMSGLAHAPTAGDFYIVQATIPGNPQAGWWPSTSGGATLTADTTDLSPKSPGKQALKMNAAGSGQGASVASYFDTMNGRSFLQLNGTYTLTFRAKGLGGSNSLSVNVSRQGTPKHGTVTYLNQNVPLTNQWQDYTFSFHADEDGSYIGVAGATFGISGGSALLDDAALTEEAASDNPTPFRNAVVNRLRELHPGVLRYMDNGTDFGSTIDNLIAVPGARQRAGYSQNSAEQDDVPIGLVEFLQLCQAIDAEPWFTVPNAVSPTEMQHLIQFLNGDASTKYGALRASLGQSAPWTSVFPAIHLELGNENWNTGSFPGETINDPVVTGQRAQDVFTAARQSAEYDSSKFDLIMDGWAVVPWYNQQELLQTSAADTIDVAPYTFNAFNSYGSNEAIYGSMFAEPEAIDSLSSGYMYQQMQTAAAASHPVKLAVYEVNLSTVSGTASQSLVNQVVPSVGAGLSTVEHMLLMMRDDGVTLQSMFALPEYANGFNNTNGGSESTPLWGTVIDMGGATNLCRPQFLAEALANTAITGNLLETIQTGANPTWNQPTNSNTKIATPNAHYLQSFAFSDGSNNGVIVFNLHRTSALPVTFSGDHAPKGTVKIGQLTSKNVTDNNEQSNVVSTTNTTVSNFDPTKSTSLPPFSMTVITWGGDSSTPAASTQATKSQLTASPMQVTAGHTVTLSASVTAGSGTPDGSVNVLDGSTSLGIATLSKGTATFTTTALSAGVHTLIVNYQGSSGYDASSSTAVQVTVSGGSKNTTSTALSTNNSGVNPGSPLSFAVAVVGKSGSQTPTGSVSVLLNGQNFASAKLSGGKATVSAKAPAAGSYTATARYSGDGSDAASTSNNVAIAVVSTQPKTVATSTTVSVNPTAAVQGQNAVLSAKVSPSSGTTMPTGSVQFFLGSTSIGSAALNGGIAAVPVTAPSAGTYELSAKYTGNSGANASSSGNVPWVVGAPAPAVVATITQLQLSTTNVTVGGTVNITVAVTSANGKTTPKGTVSISGSPTTLTPIAATNGKAALQLDPKQAGVFTLVADFTGDGKTSGSSVSKAVVLTVNPAPTGVPIPPTPAPPPPPTPAPTPTPTPTPTGSGSVSLQLSTSSVELQQGQTSPVTVQVTPKDGFSQTVNLACQGLPANVDCSFRPASLPVANSPASTTMNVSSSNATNTAASRVGLSGIAYGAMLPWNLIGMLATAAARKRRKLGMLRTMMLLVLTGAGAMAISGCGVAYNTVAQTYQVTLTATANGATVNTATFNVVLNQKTTPW
jgi:hypothetical protein